MHVADETVIGLKEPKGYSYVKIDGGEPAMGNACLGQEGVMLTPVQIASLVATIADDGRWSPPVIVRYTLDEKGEKHDVVRPPKEQVLQPRTAREVQGLMEAVISSGTGKTAALTEVKVAGKTATSQTGRIMADGTEVLNTWFVGYFPAENPKWAVVVLAEQGKSGAESSAPIFREIARGILKYHSAH